MFCIGTLHVTRVIYYNVVYYVVYYVLHTLCFAHLKNNKLGDLPNPPFEPNQF